MKVQVDVELLRATAAPLREAVAVLDGLPAVRAELGGGTASGAVLGEPALGDAVERFLACWSGGMSGVRRPPFWPAFTTVTSMVYLPLAEAPWS